MQHIKNYLLLILFLGTFITSADAFYFHYPKDEFVLFVQDSVAKPHYKEPEYIDSLNTTIRKLFGNYDLSWDDILTKLDSLQLDVSENFGKESLSAAFVIHKKGVVYAKKGAEGNINAYYQAIDMYQQAINIRIAKVDSIDQDIVPDIINGYFNISNRYLALNDPYKAIEYSLKGISMGERYANKEKLIKLNCRLLISLARSYIRIGDYDNAISYYRKLIDFKPPNNSSSQSIELVRKWIIIGLIEFSGHLANSLMQPDEAIKNLINAKEILSKENESHGSVQFADIYHNLGIACDELNDFTSSLEYYRSSISINRQHKNTKRLANNYHNIAVVFNNLNLLDSAEYYLNQADDLFESLEELNKQSYILDNLGDIAFKRGEFEKSIHCDNQAMAILVPEYDYKPDSLFLNPTFNQNIVITDKKGLLISLESKAVTCFELYKIKREKVYLEEAMEAFSLADQLIGQIRSEFLNDGSKLWLTKSAKDIYSKSIHVCWELYQLTRYNKYKEQAFNFSEKNHAIVLLDAIRKAKTNSLLDSRTQNEIQKLNYKITHFEKESVLANHSSLVLDSLLLYRRKLTANIQKIQANYPNYYELIYSENQVTLASSQKLVGNDEAFLEYFVGDSITLFCFVLTQDTSLFLKKELVEPVIDLVAQYQNQIGSLDQRCMGTAHLFYTYFIQPITKHISLPNQLIIIPDAEIASIPFETLVTQDVTGERIYFPSFKDYLLYNHAIAYSFSVSMLKEINSKNSVSQKGYLGIAPSFQEDFRLGQSYFNKLEKNVKEVQMGESIFGGMALLEDKATKQVFLEKASDYQILHLATHAKANLENGDFSFIMLGKDSLDFLYAKDLYALNLSADLVLLSACQTGIGTVNISEGNISLARGFIYSGVSSVITSLWNVNEEANHQIVTYFYEGLKDGLSKSQALQKAKINYLETIHRDNQEMAHPFYWASVICVGNDKKINFENKNNMVSLVLPLTIILISSFVLLLIFLRKKSKSARIFIHK